MTVKDTKMTFNIWDTAGHQDYRLITANFLRGSSAILLAFDLTRKETYDTLKGWMEIIEEYSDNSPIIFLLGNKADKLSPGDERPIPLHLIEQFRKENNINQYFEVGWPHQVSARDGKNINEAFKELAEVIYQEFELKKKRNHLNNTSVLTKKSFRQGEDSKKTNKKGKGCC